MRQEQRWRSLQEGTSGTSFCRMQLIQELLLVIVLVVVQLKVLVLLLVLVLLVLWPWRGLFELLKVLLVVL